MASTIFFPNLQMWKLFRKHLFLDCRIHKFNKLTDKAPEFSKTAVNCQYRPSMLFRVCQHLSGLWEEARERFLRQPVRLGHIKIFCGSPGTPASMSIIDNLLTPAFGIFIPNSPEAANPWAREVFGRQLGVETWNLWEVCSTQTDKNVVEALLFLGINIDVFSSTQLNSQQYDA